MAGNTSPQHKGIFQFLSFCMKKNQQDSQISVRFNTEKRNPEI